MKLDSRTLFGSSAESKRGQKSPSERHTSNTPVCNVISLVCEMGKFGLFAQPCFTGVGRDELRVSVL